MANISVEEEQTDKNLSKMSLCNEGWYCLISFLIGACVGFMSIFNYYALNTHWLIPVAGYLLIYIIVSLSYFWCTNKWYLYEVSWRAGMLGSGFGLGLLACYNYPQFSTFGIYVTLLSFFHWSEYFTTAVTNPTTLTLASYLLDHSIEYKLAAVASWVEYFVEYYFYPDMKHFWSISACGLTITIIGECLRKASMLTATTNFNHYIQRTKNPGHTLVTHGVYSVCRHPSYVGWFWWSIGTQLLLCNPICLIGYTIVSWQFFNERIFTEEIFLHQFFGEQFGQYQKRVSTGIPFIRGCRL